MNDQPNVDKNTFFPHKLIDGLIEKLSLKNDAALCRVLSVQPPIISKIRHGHLPVGASLLIRMHEETGLSIRDLRVMMGDQPDSRRFVSGKINDEE